MHSSFSMAPAAQRGSNGFGFGGIRLGNPVVRAPATARQSEPAVRVDDESTRYTPGTRRGSPHAEGQERGRASANGASASYEAVSQSISYQRNDSFQLSVRTAEGDTATISLARGHSESASVAASRYTSAGAQGQSLALSSSRADSLDLQISVAGDLNDQETASINALLKKVQGVADDFFAGNQAQAASSASGLGGADGGGSDDNSLSAFSFQLQTRESLRAVSTYESVALSTAPTPAATGDTSAAAIPGRPQSAPPDFLRQWLSMLDNAARSAQEQTGAHAAEASKPKTKRPVELAAAQPAPPAVAAADKVL